MPLNLFSSSSGSSTALAARVTRLEVKPSSLHDAGEISPVPVSIIPGAQHHLEGGKGFVIDSSLLSDNWFATVLNSTDTPQPISWRKNDSVFIRNGEPISAAESPYIVHGNTWLTLECVSNGGQWIQIIPNGAALQDLTPPRLVLLDPIEDIKSAGNHEVQLRIYIDD
jgi:hypothetical protein